MTMRPAVSVLVAVHNGGEFLAAAVTSVLAQTCADFELLLIDDESTDGAVERAAAGGDSRIRVFRQQRSGAPAAINAGLAQSSGEIIALLDQDDLWHPRKLQAHVDYLAAHPDVDLTFDWSTMIDAQGNDLGLASRSWHGTISFEQMLEDFVIRSTSAIVARRSAIARAGPLDQKLPRVYDLDLCLRIAAQRPGNCAAVAERLTLYRWHPAQMSRDWRALRTEWESLLQRVCAYAPRPPQKVLPLADSNMLRYFAWIACEEAHYGEALRLALASFRRAPRRAFCDPRNWMLLAALGAALVLPRSVYRRAQAWAGRRRR